MIRIAVDAMGGDYAPKITVEGAMLAVKKFNDITITLYGDENKIKPFLTDSTRINVVHTADFIDMGEKDPIKQIRNNRKSSLCLTFKALKEEEADCAVTSGPTQAVVVGAHLIVKRLENMSRVGLCPILPSVDGKSKLLLDVGANVELRSEHILELAIYASVAAKEYLKIENPVVGLLNIGTEPGKGRQLDKETFDLLSNNEHINFYGNVEPKEILTNECDVLVTDGFTGNMVLKTLEGTAKGTGLILAQEIKKTFFGKIGYLFMKKNLKNYKKRLSADEVGGAMICGIQKPVVKAHGSSDAYAFSNAIKQVRELVLADVVNKVASKLPKENVENEQ